MINPDWKQFQDYIAGRLQSIDPNARSSKGSGNKGEIADINNKYLAIECKQTEKKSISLEREVWLKLCSEVPLHSKRIPMYALQDGEGNKWAVLDLDTFLDIFIDHVYYDEGCGNE